MKHELPEMVVRIAELEKYTGNKRTQNEELIRLGVFTPFSMGPGGRSKVIPASQIVAAQKAAQAAGGLAALIGKLKQERADKAEPTNDLVSKPRRTRGAS